MAAALRLHYCVSACALLCKDVYTHVTARKLRPLESRALPRHRDHGDLLDVCGFKSLTYPKVRTIGWIDSPYTSGCIDNPIQQAGSKAANFCWLYLLFSV
jgi:hypothetical protein